MKLLLSSLLLASLCVLSSLSVSSDTLVVNQTPDVSDVMEGETVTITCCWTGEAERVIVNWLKNQIEIKSEVVSKNRSPQTSDCLDLTFMNITREDSGNYTCRVSVDIPFFITSEGNGTVITVTARENMKDNADDNTDPPIAVDSDLDDVLIFALRCLPLLVLVITFFYLNMLVSRVQQHTPAAPGTTLPSAQRMEEGHEEEEQRETEKE